jgi:phage/plasmid primase-like uncharacterized protein
MQSGNMIAADEIERARDVPIEHEIARRGTKLTRAGAELVGPCPKCGGTDRFSINTRKKVFNCRGCNVGGDVIKLVQLLDGSDFKGAVEALVGNTTRLARTAKRASTARSDGNDDKERASNAAWLWSQRRPITEGTPPAHYLRRRGYIGTIPATLGYLPARDPHPAAMVAAFGIADEPEPGIIVPPKVVKGIHLTRLTADGEKAPNAAGKAKIMVGVCKGGPITISPPNDLLGLAVAEGIEDGLSVYQGTGLGIWAAGSGGFMPALAPLVPEYIETVTIFAHDDETGRGGAIGLATALKARGIDVRLQGL